MQERHRLRSRAGGRLLLVPCGRDRLGRVDARTHSEAALSLGRLKVRTDVVELAVIPPRPVGRLELEDPDLVRLGEPADLTTEAVADAAQHGGRRDRLAQVPVMTGTTCPP